jgi:hypothetical protein
MDPKARGVVAVFAALALIAQSVAGTAYAVPAGRGAAVPSTLPGAPTGLSGTPSNRSAVLKWIPPTTNGGSPITGYVITAVPGGATVTTTTVTTYVVGGLSNGTAYVFTVAAINAQGTGPASASSPAIKPAAPRRPAAPTSVTAIGNNTAASVSWTAPKSTATAPLQRYVVTASPGGASSTVNAELTTASVSGLTNGTSYTFTVVAVNSAGSSPASAPSAATKPAVTAPAAPASVQASPTGTAVTVTWAPPANDGGTAITAYKVTASPGGAIASVDASTTTAVIANLIAGTSYTFTVNAVNGRGRGAGATSLPTAPDVTVPASTHVLSGNTLAALDAVHTDGTMTFTNPPAEIKTLPVGDTLVAGVSRLTPQGLLVKVVSVATAGSTTTVATTASTLDEAVHNGAASLVASLPNTALRSFVAATRGVTLASPEAASGRTANTDSSLTFTIDVTLYQDSQGRKVHVVGTDSITPHVSFDAGVSCCFSVHSHFKASVTAESKVAVTAELEGTLSGGLPLGTATFSPIDVQIGPVPVVVVPVLEFTLEAEGSISVGATMSAASATTAGVDITSRDGSVKATHTNSHKVTFTAPTIFAATSLKVGPRAQLTLKLYGIDGPFVQATLWLKFSADTSEDPWWTFGLDFTIGAGFKIDLLKVKWEKDPLFDLSMPLASAPGPYQAVLVTPQSPTAPSLGKVQLAASVRASNNQSVVWSIPAGSGGTITPTGLYTAPNASGVYLVVATSPANGLKPESRGYAQIHVGVQPPTAPSAVIGRSPSYGTATISWTAPTSNGGGAITSYQVTTSPSSATTTVSGTTATVSALAPGAEYTFGVVAVNSGGTSPPSPPSAPLVISDTPGTKASPTFVTQASTSVPAGGVITDTATLMGGANPTGTITYTLFAPGDAACAAPIGSRTSIVAGNGNYTPWPPFPTTVAGTYKFVSGYSGDSKNNPATGACGDANESVTVT